MLTVTGPPGVGKTRLAAAVAEQLATSFADGIVHLDLSEVSDHRAVATLLASQRLGHTLIVLDNFEHLLEASDALANLLAAGPLLKLLITSRVRLHLRWEYVLTLDPLALTDSIELFVERAEAVEPSFTADASSQEAIAQLCARLDGLPLAIELAAARVAVLPPRVLLARLAERLELLVASSADGRPGHRSLRKAIGWSYALLNPVLQGALQRLAVFEGAITLEGASAVLQSDALDTLGVLTHASLLQRISVPTGEPRFRMLESVRRYAAERLALAGEFEQSRERWFAYVQRRVLGAARSILSQLPTGAMQLDVLETEHDDVLAALQLCSDTHQTELGLRLASSWSGFWLQRGAGGEGRRWLEWLLAQDATRVDQGARAQGLFAAAGLALAAGDASTAGALEHQALTLRAAPSREPRRDDVQPDRKQKESVDHIGPSGLLRSLTDREREVAMLLLRGMTNRQIGEELIITERTAETHVCRILAKLKLKSRAQLARWLVDQQSTTEQGATQQLCGEPQAC
jgi:predicted ATPase/DNA-binding CsgD family transcriptional regulator